MLLTTALLLGGISAVLEIYLVRKSRWLDWLLRRAGWVPIVFSMVLSVLLGMAFGAAGVIVMFAGVLSTVIVQPYYWMTSEKARAKTQAVRARVQKVTGFAGDLWALRPRKH